MHADLQALLHRLLDMGNGRIVPPNDDAFFREIESGAYAPSEPTTPNRE
jgi:hypothetical protein